MQNDRTLRIITRALSTSTLAAAFLFCALGCHSNTAAAAGQDPADANLAPANGQTQVLDQNSSYAPQQQGENYPEGQQAPAPIVQGSPNQAQSYPGGYGPDDSAEQAGEDAIEETDQAPPPLPEYEQPPAPGPDYLWTPGYWAWGPEGYYWVPGAWVEAPYYGALWTPPWWGWYGGHYRFHGGYWGPHVGYYGGIDYGFGYIGIGYFGGYWSGNNFYYNRSVTRVGGGIRNYYDRPVEYNNRRYGAQPSNRVSYNGGRGGINRAPLPAELAAGRERHVAALPVQRQVRTSAGQNRSQFFNQNHGRPASTVETRGFANPHGIAPTPRGVQPGRPGMPAPNAVQPGRPGNVAPNTAGERGVPNREPNGVNGTRREANPGVNPRMNPGNARPVQPNQPGRTEQPQQRMQTPQNRAVPQQRMQTPQNRPVPQERTQTPRAVPQNRPVPQQRMETPRPVPQSRPAPQERMQAPRPVPQSRPAPQQRMQAPRPAPQSRPAPQPRAQAPRPAPQSRPAPQPHGGGNEHPQGNEHGHR